MVGKKFKLEQVLNYRKEVEKARTREFATAKLDFELASDVLKSEVERVEDLNREFTVRQQQIDNIVEMQMYADFFTRKREDIKNQKERVEYLDTVMSTRHGQLLDASKDKKVLESLKEKKLKALMLEMSQKERTFMDEIAIQRKSAHH